MLAQHSRLKMSFREVMVVGQMDNGQDSTRSAAKFLRAQNPQFVQTLPLGPCQHGGSRFVFRLWVRADVQLGLRIKDWMKML